MIPGCAVELRFYIQAELLRARDGLVLGKARVRDKNDEVLLGPLAGVRAVRFAGPQDANADPENHTPILVARICRSSVT